MKITEKNAVYIVDAYQNQLVPMFELAARFNVSRQAIYKLLKRAGVDTRKRLITVSCTACNTQIKRPKSQIRKRRHIFCSTDCYSAYLSAGGKYVQDRHSCRIARSIVKEHFDLQDTHIVHHIDKNQFNNSLDNLMVFENQGDHIRHHRGFDVKQLWP